MSKNNSRIASSKRYNTILSLRNKGMTYAAIGLKIGLSGERIRQILLGNNNHHKEQKTITENIPLKTSDVARLLNIHTNTVRRWANSGLLKTYRIGSRRDRRFKREDIDQLYIQLDAGLVEPS